MVRKYAKKRLSRRVRKRPYQRRRRVPRALNSIPNKTLVKLKYATQAANLNPAIGTAAVAVFRANDLYDPEVAVGGHQPRCFDQWILMYDHFVVIKSSIKVKFVNTDLDYEHVSGIACMDTNTARANVNDYLEMDRVKYASVYTAPCGRHAPLRSAYLFFADPLRSLRSKSKKNNV